MNQETRTYRLKVESPIHMGCGDVYEPTSFAIQEEKKVLISFNAFSFLESLESQELDSFSAICKRGTPQSLLDIYKFIRRHADNIKGQEITIGQTFLAHYQKTLAITGNKVQQELNNFQIARTAYMPLLDEAYIPGSSIKGSIRTAVLNLRHLQKRQFSSKDRFAHKQLEKDILDGGAFATDPFSRCKISDFRPVSPVSRRIIYAIDKKKKENKHEASAPYQILEIIEPGAIFEGTITLAKPDRAAGITTPLSFDELEKALKTFYEKEGRREQQEAFSIGVDSKAVYPDFTKGTVLRLGRHSGAESVTIDGHREIKIMGKRGEQPKYLKHATTTWFASDQQKTSNNGSLRPFGWASLAPASQEDIEAGKIFSDKQLKQYKERLEGKIAQQKLNAEKYAQREAEKEARKQEQERLAEEQRKYPWRSWIKNIADIADWGSFKQNVLDYPQAGEWRTETEVAQAVYDIAMKVKKSNPKKWNKDRDDAVAAWLEPTSVPWLSIASKTEDSEIVKTDLYLKIEQLSDWGQYNSAGITLTDIKTLAEAQLLKSKLNDWGCSAKKAKKDKLAAWKDINGVIKGLKP